MDEQLLHPKERVFETIKEKIINKEWTPGMKISSENQLAKELGVSRISVREAMEKLVALNVLVKSQGEGTFVNDLSPSIYLNSLIHMTLLDKDNFIDILEFRKILEVDSVQLFTQRCSEEELAELEETYERMQQFRNDQGRFYIADAEFHMTIAKGTKNSLIIKVNSVLADLFWYHQKKLHQHLGPQGGLEEHKAILDAVKAKDAEMAGLFMKRHIERTMAEIQNVSFEDDWNN